jgi:gliding motility-associated-like protein
VKIFLTGTTCKSVSDSIILYIIPVPQAIAGPDQTVCANNALTSLNGNISNASGALWSSSGSGNFSPNSTATTATYTPSAADVVRGYATLVLTTTGNGNCSASTDTLNITITPAPTTNAGNDQVVCADLNSISLSGSLSIASGVTWSTSGTGTFSASGTSLNISYTPSAADKIAGGVTITITTTGNGNCIPVSDNMALTITPAPTINAGSDLTACEDVSDVAFYGTATVATGGAWTSLGTGTFNNANNLQTIYTLSATDKSNGSVKLILTSTGNGICMAVKDTTILFLTNLPLSNAGTDKTVCNGNTGIQLNGTITGASGGTWTSTGTGSFTAIPSQLNAIYVPTPADTNAGFITLTLTTNVIGGCSVYDSINITFINPQLNLASHYCFANNLLINSSPYDTMPGGIFNWYRNDTLLTGQNNTTLTLNQRGIYTVSYTFDQCTIEDSTNITLPIELETTDKLICAGGTTTLTTTNVLKTTYEWVHQGITLTGNTNSITVTDDGNIMYFVTSTDSLLCQNTDTAYVNTIPPPVMTLTNIPSCIGQTVLLNATPSNNTDPVNSSYTWFYNNTQLPDTTASISVSETGNYSVIYLLGECSAKDSSLVTFYPLPIPSNKPYANFCKETDNTTTLDAGPATHYLWTATSDTTRTEIVSIPGMYQVQIINQYNCSVTDSILVKDVCPPRVFIPTVFSPNGDGKNDGFTISTAHIKNMKLTIFNRWGEIIYYTEDKNFIWDGTYREEAMPIGVYAWVMSYEGEFEEYKGPFKEEGSVTITR